ncbi:MAG: hypothetical protein M3315_08080 [Actinomycetota bacterium]|jgi:hypothetical protein|nr:hypothetical protein [Actinomycetota bacterium]
MRRIVLLLTVALFMTTMLLTLPAASASAHPFGDCDFDDPCNSGFVPRDFDEDDFGFVPVNQGFFIDEDDLDDCDFVPGWGWMCD